MNSIQSTDYKIHFKQNSYSKLNNYLLNNEVSSLFILVDTNTKKHCLPHLLNKLTNKFTIEVIEIKAGEIHKNIDTCVNVWNRLTTLNADRKSLLINLGGGVITDLGGFVASTYKRGVRFINIPTTLLSMVDASVGSKTGVDLGNLKNLIGLFSNPEMVLIDDVYLKTVSEREIRSGFAEIIKYGLSYDKALWNEIIHNNILQKSDLLPVIRRSIEIKNEIVLKDIKESSLRKILNFGHTAGHAIESYFLESNELTTLTHGEAIAIGMVIESYISHKLFGFSKETLELLKETIIKLYGKTTIDKKLYNNILELTKHDKKNIGNVVKFVLLKDIANYKIDCTVDEALLIEAFNYYNS